MRCQVDDGQLVIAEPDIGKNPKALGEGELRELNILHISGGLLQVG